MRRRGQLRQGLPGGESDATGHALRTVPRQPEGPHLVRSPGRYLLILHSATSDKSVSAAMIGRVRPWRWPTASAPTGT